MQALRAFLYGFGSVLLGASLGRSGLSGLQSGIVFAALLAGSALVSFLIVARADVFGRRRLYVGLLLVMAAAGTVFALTAWFPALILAALTGTLSVEVTESGPFTSLEQAMIPSAAPGRDATTRAFGTYNAISALVGAAGALAAGGPSFLRGYFPRLPADRRFFLVYPVVAAVAAIVAAGLSKAVEVPEPVGQAALERFRPQPGRLHRSRRIVMRLSALQALDAFAGGFIVQSYLVYWFTREFHASTLAMGITFFGVGLIQSVSFLLAVRLARRVGLLNTMVFTHLPSNILLLGIPLAPNLTVAIAVLLIRYPLSQMDVPTRQAYLAAMVDPDERAVAAGVTNAARTAVRPWGAPIAGALAGTPWSAVPFIVAATLKSAYDLTLYRIFRKVPLPDDTGA